MRYLNQYPKECRSLVDADKRVITHLYVDDNSAVSISSATIARKSKICSVDTLLPENNVIQDKIQLGQTGGRVGASLIAKAVI
jgi:hypothetical protein